VDELANAVSLANDSNPALGAALIGYNGGTVADALDAVGSTGTRTLESFGVVGDGVTDDTAAMQAVAAYTGYVVGAPNLVVLTDELDFTGSLSLDMRGGTIKSRTALHRHDILADNVKIYNAIFDVDNKNVNVALFRITSGNTGWVFNRCTFKNIVGIGGGSAQYAFYIDADDMVGDIESCWFENISQVSNGTPLSAFCGAILLFTNTVGAQRVNIKDCVVKNIFCTGIAGNINNSDADGIRLYGNQPTTQSNVTIKNFLAIDVQKSGIKASGQRGILVDGVKVVNDRSDIGMIAGVRFQAADDSIIRNIELVGRMDVGINIRSSRTIVDGVTYAPINTARDVVSSGLIQLQSDDTYQTSHIKVNNVIGSNVQKAFDFDLTGTTANTVFTFIEFNNWDITGLSVASAGTISSIQKATHVTLNSVQLWDPQSSWLNSIAFVRVVNFKARNCRFEARREMFTWDPNCSGIEFDHCSFFRQDSATVDNFGMLIIRDSGGNTIDRVTIRNCTISCPTYSTVGNQHALRFYATNGNVEGLNIYVRSASGNVSPPTGWVSASVLASKISDVKVSAEVTLTNGAGGYAVDLTATSVANVITDIHCASGPGVRAPAGANNNLIDTVAGKVAAVSNSGTGNTVGSAHILP
jgi:hypothetical protein